MTTAFDVFVIWALVGVYIAFGIGAGVILLRAQFRPTNARDDRLAAVDDEISEVERMSRRPDARRMR